LIDSHCHLFFDSLRDKIPKIINNAKEKNISSILSINTKMEDFDLHYKLIEKYQSVFLSCGQHPETINNNNITTTKKIVTLCNNSKVIAIGETGIDLYHSNENIKYQYECFENHIQASLETNLPLIIHQRNSENEVIEILSNFKNYNLKLVMHCFTGSKKLRDFCIDLNYYISLSGIITFKNANDLRNIIKDVPLNSILIETDSPFLTPSPYRGIKPNEPSYVYYIAQYLAEFFNLSIKEFETITDNNFYSLFKKAIRYKEILHEN